MAVGVARAARAVVVEPVALEVDCALDVVGVGGDAGRALVRLAGIARPTVGVLEGGPAGVEAAVVVQAVSV